MVHGSVPRCWLALLAFVLSSALAQAHAAQASIAPAVASPNKGKPGTYHVDSKTKGYGYFVFVPPCYSDAKPAGIHLFFHGQSCQGGAPNFGSWDGPFLSRYNLIGINMQYMDGDNGADTAGKVAAAREAVAQVIADYKIVVGRGVICSFSGGGLPHGLFAEQASKTRGPEWPFSHVAMYSSNYFHDASLGCASSWYIGVGSAEWTLADLGGTATHRTLDLFGTLKRGGCPDISFTIIKGKGHCITEADVAESSKGFGRSDLALTPFLYAPDYAEPELRAAVNACGNFQLNSAMTLARKLAAKPDLAAPLAAKVEALATICDARIQAIKAEATQLAAEDPVLATYYLPMYQQECHGSPVEKEIKDLISHVSHEKGYPAAMAAHDQMLTLLPQVLAGGGATPDLVPDKVPALEALAKVAVATSQTGKLAADLLALKK